MLQLYFNIKERRLSLGMTQTDLAMKTGYADKSMIAKIEKGLVDLPQSKISEFAAALGTTPAALMGWEPADDSLPSPGITDDVVTFPVLGEVAAGYDHIANENWGGETVDIPCQYLRGRPACDYFTLRVCGNSMYPQYIDGDIVLVLRQATMNRSGEIGVVVYDSEIATLKKVEYVMGEDWMKLIPINPEFAPIKIEGADLERCRVLGLPRLLVREIKD